MSLMVQLGVSEVPLVFYSGARRWEGAPEIRPGRKGHVEHGPGIYMTTSLETARKYAKGGGAVMRFELSPQLRWLEDAKLPAIDVLRFLSAKGGLRSRDLVREDVQRYMVRAGIDSARGILPASVLVNLAVNHEAASGQSGQLLAAFLAAQGIDASHVRQSNEDWVVLFNPEKVLRVTQAPADAPWDLPRVQRG